MTKLTGSQFTRDRQTGRVLKVRGNFELPVAETSKDGVKSFLFANIDELELNMQADDLMKSTGRGNANREGRPIYTNEERNSYLE